MGSSRPALAGVRVNTLGPSGPWREQPRFGEAWQNTILEVRHASDFKPGERVDWVIPPARIVLHRRDRPSRGEHENPVMGTIAESITLGEITHTTMHVGGDPASALGFSVPTHVALRNRLAEGGPVTVSLLADGIHLMPPTARGSREAGEV